MPADMKELIADAAKTLVIDENVKKLTVKDIVEKCHITRQTFYYHFEDIPHLLQWILEQEIREMHDSARSKDSMEERLRYFFTMAVQLTPYIRKTMESSYGEELRHLLKEESFQLLLDIVREENLYRGLSREELKLVLRYHSQAIIGFLLDWSDQDTENLDAIVHTVYRILNGEIMPAGKTDR